MTHQRNPAATARTRTRTGTRTRPPVAGMGALSAVLAAALAVAGCTTSASPAGTATSQSAAGMPGMAGMSGTEFYEAAIKVRPELARRAVFMSGDVLNPDLRGFATQRNIRLLAKPFDIDAVVQVVRDVLAAADRQAGTSAGST